MRQAFVLPDAVVCALPRCGMVCLGTLMLLWAQGAGAQPVLYNNRNHLPTGDAAALQGGAYIARAADASASWYNPAGLVRAPRDAISGNASLYSYNQVSFDGGSAAVDYGTTPTFIGSLTRDAASGQAGSAWGFSIVTPLDVNITSKRAFQQDYTVGGAGLIPAVQTVLTDSSQATMFAPGVAWSHAWGESSSIGYGIRIYQLNIDLQTSSIFYQDPGAGAPYFSAVENIAFSASATMARLEAGWQSRLSDTLRIGAVLRSETSLLTGRARVLTNFQQYFNAGTPVSAFASANNDDVEVSYGLPWEMGVGLAWVRGSWELELDAIYYHKMAAIPIAPAIDVLVITTVGNSPSSSVIQEQGVTFESRSFVNVALGGRTQLKPGTWLNLGLYTDRSPGHFTGSPLFSEVDFTGLTVGTTVERENSSTSWGVTYLQGQASEPFDATPSIVPTPARAIAIQHRELSFVLAGSLQF